MVITAVLCAVALLAGVMDAIAGGGGLLTLPALLIAAPDVRVALGTNKGQSVFGSITSLVSFARTGHIDKRRAVPSFFAALVGSLLGVKAVFALRPEALRPAVLALLLVVAVLFAASGSRRRATAKVESALLGQGVESAASAADARPAPSGWSVARAHPAKAAGLIGLALGFYDGFFGPGTGTFLIALYAGVFGDDLTRATANAKVANFASNLGACASYAAAGAIDYRLVLPMAAAQMVGGYLGARAAIRGGDRLIRAGVLAVTIALVIRLSLQLIQGRG